MFAAIKQLFHGLPALPAQWQDKAIKDVPLLAVDLELTSLDVNNAKITSVGWVEGKNNSINLNQCFYSVTRAKGDFAQSPVIHGITEGDVAYGIHIREVLNALRQYAKTHLWLCHNASLDLGILQRVFHQTGIHCPDIVYLDTLQLAVYQLKKHHEVLPPNSATLSVCRQRLDLPAVPAHNALDDAMATMQLWFAQSHALNGSRNVKIGDLLHTRAISVRKMTPR
ncbi:3'-5' exonuclease [Alteromonas sp. C1M14]|uniref:3'-5' exonuclease n=1 Tax=Alteromonas sp. C1M14 TaxID=2841567 RepID=UPI001C089532|nr:3'-5' exonuclease [Alteromonas sp. C1M14]MBU2976675.1 3'-5' exonuclease [Alteromonas sp. C1M14]